MPRLGRTAHLAASLAAFTLLGVAWTWPVAGHLSTRIPHDPGDPILNTWILWWNAHAVPFTSAWWSPPIFFPMRDALALSEHLAGLSLLASPVQWAGGSPLLAYNVCLLASCALSGWFAYLLVLRLTASPLAAACGGVAFAVAPYRAGQLAHVQVLSSEWMPLVLLAMHAYLATGKWRWLSVFSAAWLIQALSNGYYLLFLPILIGLWLVWFVDWKAAPGKGLRLVLAWAAGGLPLIPALMKYRDVHDTLDLVRPPGEVARFSATFASFLHAPPLLAFWPTHDVPTQEDYLFPGVTAIAVTIAALLVIVLGRQFWQEAKRRSPLLFYGGATIVMWSFTVGPGEGSVGLAAAIRPYHWLSLLPGYEALRVPSRFAMIASLCLSISAGMAVSRLARLGRSRGRAIGAAALLGLALDGWTSAIPLGVPPPRAVLPPLRDAAVLELPADDARVSVAAMYRAMSHGLPLVNGYSGHIPPHYAILSQALRRGDASPLVLLARGRPLLIVVNDRFDEGGAMRRVVESLPSIERLETTGAGTTFRLPAQPREPEGDTGTPLPASMVDAGAGRLLVDLGEPRAVRSVMFALHWHYGELGDRLSIDVSQDGQRWERAWAGWTGAPAFAASLEDPSLTPVRLPLRDARARYLRIYPAPAWLASELRVFGP